MTGAIALPRFRTARSRRAAGIAVAVVALLLGSGTRARAQEAAGTGTEGSALADYDPHSEAWNGMSRFVALAEGEGFSVSPVSELDWDQLSADDILFLVYPLQRVEPGRLSAFVQAGGNVVIADDFGESRDAMAALGLLRADVTTPHASRFYKDRLWAPIATARGDHPVGAEVGDVVTNHPAALRQIHGAETVVAFDSDAVVVAGERGTGKFVAVSDPSIFINRMQGDPFGGNVRLTINILRWLSREGRAKHVVLLRGDVPMYGDPKPFIDDPRGGQIGRSVAGINSWLYERSEWLLTPDAMRGLAAALAALLLGLAVAALPVRRGPRIDGAWLRFGRPSRRDDPHGLVATAEGGQAAEDPRDARRSRRPRGDGSLLVLACILRDQVQHLVAEAIAPLGPVSDPLYTLAERELVARVSSAKGNAAGIALSRVYRRLRALPSRGQAAAPWSSGHLGRRDFDALYRDVAELCRTLGHSLTEASPESA